METACHSKNRHPSDADLLEGILSREGADPRVEACPDCRSRRDRLQAAFDPSEADALLEAAEPFFDVRQAAKIRARIAARPRWRQRLLSALGVAHPLRALAAVAAVAVVVLFAGLREGNRLPVDPVLVAVTSASASSPLSDWTPTTEEDRADDAMLDEIDALISEDPYSLGGLLGS